MRTAVMQPYLFPYIGYFQLVRSVETFVFFDDVNFIKRGFIHRNSIAANGEKLLFTVPLSGASQNSAINEIEIQTEHYKKWWRKFQGTLQMNYSSAPYYKEVMDLVRKVMDEPSNKISKLASRSVVAVSEYLGLSTNFLYSSEIEYAKEVQADDKVISICKKLSSNSYINPIGGSQLYSQKKFDENKISLQFFKSRENLYTQKSEEFLSSLSIIDVLMNNEKLEVLEFLDNYDLLKKEQL